MAGRLFVRDGPLMFYKRTDKRKNCVCKTLEQASTDYGSKSKPRPSFSWTDSDEKYSNVDKIQSAKDWFRI